jgi:hypothetical protein
MDRIIVHVNKTFKFAHAQYMYGAVSLYADWNKKCMLVHFDTFEVIYAELYVLT